MFSEAAGYISGRYAGLEEKDVFEEGGFPRPRAEPMDDRCPAMPRWQRRMQSRSLGGASRKATLTNSDKAVWGDVCTVLYGISEKQISIANVNYPGQSAHHVIGLATFGATPPQRAFSYMPQVLLLAIQLFAQLYSKPHLYKEIHQMCISTGLCYTYEPPPLASHSCA
jgi:hypothetical protein